MPATTKVLSIIDKGVQDRVTKNGECLRRHAECTQRWRNLKERISRTDRELDAVRRLLLAVTVETTSSECESNVSGVTSRTRDGHLTTPPSGGGQPSKSKSGSTLSRSISPFRKLARKMKKGHKSPMPETPPLPKLDTRLPSSEPVRSLKHRSSLFNLMSSQPLTPERPTHKYSHSLTPDSSPSKKTDSNNNTVKISRPAWNSSTKVEDEHRTSTVKAGSQRRASHFGVRAPDDHSPMSSVTGTPYRRSVSRSSMASSRPWSPVTSSVSTAQSSTNQPLASLYRPPSRSQVQDPNLNVSPRARPTTPSHIPHPSGSHWRSMSASASHSAWDDDEGTTSIMQRAFSTDRAQTPNGGHPPRPPSRSMIPVPSVQISGASRPTSAMSNYRPESSMSFRGSAIRMQTPDAHRTTPRPSLIQPRLPPSSFKDSSTPRTPLSRPPSRSGAATPNHDGKGPVHVYVPYNLKDPLDAEVAAVANSISHGLLIERVDPPLRSAPREGEEVRAQYAFSNHLARKVVNCKLTTLARRENVTKKVMCRVGGGMFLFLFGGHCILPRF